MQPINPDALKRHLQFLTENIGVRLAGMPGEAAAADYLETEFGRLGVAVQRENFPVQARDVSEQELQLFYEGDWHTAGCSLFSNTPVTISRALSAEIG